MFEVYIFILSTQMFNICEIDLSFLDDHDPRSASGIQLPVMTEVVRVVNPGMRTSLLTLVLGCCLAFCLFMGLRIIPACQIVLVVNLIHTMDVYHTTSFPGLCMQLSTLYQQNWLPALSWLLTGNPCPY